MARLSDLDLDADAAVPASWRDKDSAQFCDFSQQSQRLLSWLSLRDDYMFDSSTEVETLVDDHLKKRFDNKELFGNDIALWKWLEFSAPVPN